MKPLYLEATVACHSGALRYSRQWMWALHVFIAEISLAIVIQADLWHLSAMNNVFSARLDESSSFLKAILVVSYSRFGSV